MRIKWKLNAFFFHLPIFLTWAKTKTAKMAIKTIRRERNILFKKNALTCFETQNELKSSNDRICLFNWKNTNSMAKSWIGKNDKKLFLNKIVLIISAIDRLYIIKDNKIVSEVQNAVSRLKTCGCISLVCDRVYITKDIIGLYKIWCM